jgi:hypothetical protein
MSSSKKILPERRAPKKATAESKRHWEIYWRNAANDQVLMEKSRKSLKPPKQKGQSAITAFFPKREGAAPREKLDVA